MVSDSLQPNCSPPGFSVHRILQAGIPEWVAPFLSPGDIPDPGMELGLLIADSLQSESQGKPKTFLVNLKCIRRINPSLTAIFFQANRRLLENVNYLEFV